MPFAAILFDIKDFKFSSHEEFRFAPHFLFMILVSTAVFFWYRFVYFWLLALWGLYYMYLNRNMHQPVESSPSDGSTDDYAVLIEESLIEEVDAMEQDD